MVCLRKGGFSSHISFGVKFVFSIVFPHLCYLLFCTYQVLCNPRLAAFQLKCHLAYAHAGFQITIQ